VEVIDPNAERVEERGARAVLGAEEAAGVPAEEVDWREGGGEGQDGEREQVAHPSWQSWQEQGKEPGRANRAALCDLWLWCVMLLGLRTRRLSGVGAPESCCSFVFLRYKCFYA
jgi:hypothetical protein